MNKKLIARFAKITSALESARHEASLLEASLHEYQAKLSQRNQTIRVAYSQRHSAEMLEKLQALMTRLDG